MEYEIEEKGSVSIVRINEERATILQGVDELKKALLDIIEQGHVNLVVDMSKVEFADSSMLGALVSALKMVTRKRGDLKIVGLNPPVRAIFELTRLYRVFEIFESRDDAVASF